MGTGAGIYQGGKKVSDLNPKAINVLSDGSIMAKVVLHIQTKKLMLTEIKQLTLECHLEI